MSRAPRVLYLINGFQRGGAEQGLVRLVEGGAFGGCELTIAGLSGGSEAILDQLGAAGATVELFDRRSSMSVGSLAGAAPKLLALLKRMRPHLVVLSLPQANLLGRAVTLAVPGAKIASFEHNTHLSKAVYETGYRLTSGRVDWLLADSETTAQVAQDRLYRAPPEKVVVLPLVAFGAKAPSRRPNLDRPLRLVNAARFTQVKNQAALIRAVALLRTQGVAVELTLLGEGPELESCRSLVAELGLQDRVRLPGFSEGWATSPDHDVFVLASRHEGLCIAALEAMHGGLAVVAPLIGGLHDYGRPEVMRIVPDVEPATLAAAVAELDRERRSVAELGLAAQAMVQARYGEARVRGAYAGFAAMIHEAAQAA